MKNLLLTLFIVLNFHTINGQYNAFQNGDNGDLLFGLQFGYGLDNLRGVGPTFGHERFDPSSFTFTERLQQNWSFGVSFLYGFHDSDFFINLDYDYQSSFPPSEDHFKRPQGFYSDDEDLEYAVNFPFQYSRFRFGIGWFLGKIIYLKGGINWRINSTPSNLDYNSNDPTPGRDQAIEDVLKIHINGLNTIGPFFGGAVNIPLPFPKEEGSDYDYLISIEATHSLALSDALSTSSNQYFLTDNFNKISSWNFSVGFKYRVSNR